MKNPTVADCQDRIVSTIAASLSHGWDCALVNIEIDIIDGEQTENCLALSCSRCGEQWIRTSEQLPFECYDQFGTLRELLTDAGGKPWTTCSLEFDSEGKYRYTFNHSEPPRLNGIHDDASMFKDYVPRPL